MRQKQKMASRGAEKTENGPLPQNIEFVTDAPQSPSAHPSCGEEEGLCLKNLSDTLEVGPYPCVAHILFCSLPTEIKEEKKEDDVTACQTQYPGRLGPSSSTDVSRVLISGMLAEELNTDIASGTPSGGTSASSAGEEDGKAPSSPALSSMSFNASEVTGALDTATKNASLARVWAEQSVGTSLEVKEEGVFNSRPHHGDVTTVVLKDSASPHMNTEHGEASKGSDANVEWPAQNTLNIVIKTENSPTSQEDKETFQSGKQSSRDLWNAGVKDLGEVQDILKSEPHPGKEPPSQAGCLSDGFADMLEQGLFFRLASRIGTGMGLASHPSLPEVKVDVGTQPMDTCFSPSQDPNSVKKENKLVLLSKLREGKKKSTEKKEAGSRNVSAGDMSTSEPTESLIVHRAQGREKAADMGTAHESCGVLAAHRPVKDFPDFSTPYSSRPEPGAYLSPTRGSINRVWKIICGEPFAEVPDLTLREGLPASTHGSEFYIMGSPFQALSSNVTSGYASDSLEDAFKTQLGVEEPEFLNARQLATNHDKSTNSCCVTDITKHLQIVNMTDRSRLDDASEDAILLSEEEPRVPEAEDRKSTGRDSFSLAIEGAEHSQSMDLEEVQLKRSECGVQSNTNGSIGGEIEAGSRLAFLEWDGDDAVCRMEETEKWKKDKETDYVEEEEPPFTRPQKGVLIVYYEVVDSLYRLLGARSSRHPRRLCRLKQLDKSCGDDESDVDDPQSSPKAVVEEEEEEEVNGDEEKEEEEEVETEVVVVEVDEDEDEEKHSHWTEETTQSMYLLVKEDVPEGGPLLQGREKNDVRRPTKNREQSKQKVHCGPTQAPAQSMAQVRRICVRTLYDVLLKRVLKSPDLDVQEETVKRVARNVERELFTLYLCTGSQYKKKYRTLVFNLADSRNKQLFQQVVLGEITPQCLVLMSATEMASEELTEWRDKEKKHALEIIEKEEREMQKCPVTKLTHKGIIEINTDPDQLLTLDDLKGPALDMKSSLLDPDCITCTDLESPVHNRGVGLPKKRKSIYRKKIMDAFRSFPTNEAETVQMPNVEREVLRAIPEKAPSQKTPHWEGFLQMFTLKKFGAKAFHVSGYGSSICQALPAVIQSQSCILPEAVWDYVDAIWPAESKDMSIIRFSPSDTKDSHAYSLLYAYLNAKQRYGIVNLEIMEVYVVPLASYQPIPAKLHPLGGPGLEESHNNLLLAVILPKKKPSDNSVPSSQPGTSRKRKSVTFDDYTRRKHNSMPPPHRGPRRTFPAQKLFQTSPSSSYDSWDSPQHHDTHSPKPTARGQPSVDLPPDYLNEILHELVRDDRELSSPGAGQPCSASYCPVTYQEGYPAGEAWGQEACRSGLVNVLQLLSHNIQLMSDPCGVAMEAATGKQTLGASPLINAGAPVTCSWGPQGLMPLYTVIPNHCSSMGHASNGFMVPQMPSLYYQPSCASQATADGFPQSAASQGFPIQMAYPAASPCCQHSEAATGASQCGSVDEVQSILQTLLSLTSQVSQSTGIQQPQPAGPFQQGSGLEASSVPGELCSAPVQQLDAHLAPPPLSFFLPAYGFFTSSPGS